MDEALFNTLLPIRSVWRNSLCLAPKKYSSVELFERAFNELLLCWKLSLDCEESLALARPLTSLAGIQQCQSLELWDPPCRVDTADIAEWLHQATTWEKPRYLRVARQFDEAQQLLTALKTVCI